MSQLPWRRCRYLHKGKWPRQKSYLIAVLIRREYTRIRAGTGVDAHTYAHALRADTGPGPG